MSARPQSVPAKAPARALDPAYAEVFHDVAGLLQSARAASAKSVNALMTATYWLVGKRIFEEEQRSKERAEYGARLVRQLAEDLTVRLGRGFGRANLFQMRAFFLSYRDIVQTPSGQSRQSLALPTVAGALPLPLPAAAVGEDH